MALRYDNRAWVSLVLLLLHCQPLNDLLLVLGAVAAGLGPGDHFLAVPDDDVSVGEDGSDLRVVLLDPEGGGQIEGK